MKLKRASLGLFLSTLVLLASCGPVPDAWVERLDIDIKDDLSGQVSFIILESNESISKSEDEKNTPFVDQIQTDWMKPCDVFKTQPYLAVGNARGFKATVNFASQGELMDAFTCIPILARWVKLHSLQVNESLLGTDYELQLEIFAPVYFHEVRVTLPGKIEQYKPTSLSEFYRFALPGIIEEGSGSVCGLSAFKEFPSTSPAMFS